MVTLTVISEGNYWDGLGWCYIILVVNGEKLNISDCHIS